MPQVWNRAAALLLLLLAASPPPGSLADASMWTAYVNCTYTKNNHTRSDVGELGMFGQDSPRMRVQGLVAVADDRAHRACSINTNFSAPAEGAWIALIQRGYCTFREKIVLAASRGAVGVVVFNSEPGGSVTTMSHPGTEDTVAIMIGYEKGRDILDLINQGIQVTMVIEVAKKHSAWMNHYSIFFVSVSFFIVTAATVGYFIFYSARRLRLTRAQNRKMKKLKADAKRAIGQLQLRTLKQGDTEVGPEGDSCAVCIDNYKPNDVVRILTCNHFFHKACIDPWLLEHRTCPMCKCDILKALGIEVDVEAENVEPAPDLVSTESPDVSESNASAPAWTEEDSRSETASSGYASVRGMDAMSTKEESAPVENADDNEQLVQNERNPLEVEVLPHLDNLGFEQEESHLHEVKS
ncbi:E3 ubiquitin-protein ligase RNF128 [Ambystoma mexicanum]|uniref:E3 ubiquitin-protein ligase RNF128 n=1 Tax=Ambystoma mexicanum TaxID=8296 RepID=UPI0037E79698